MFTFLTSHWPTFYGFRTEYIFCILQTDCPAFLQYERILSNESM